jgi:hypothetical protein
MLGLRHSEIVISWQEGEAAVRARCLLRKVVTSAAPIQTACAMQIAQRRKACLTCGE